MKANWKKQNSFFTSQNISLQTDGKKNDHEDHIFFRELIFHQGNIV